MSIRELTRTSADSEKDRFCDAYIRLWNQDGNLKYLSFTGIPFLREQIQAWVDGLGPGSRIQYFYTEEGQDITAILIINNDPVNGFELYGLGVDAGHQGKGLGDRLIKKAVETARAGGHRAVKVFVFADNTKMQRRILANGFFPVQVQPCRRYDGTGLVEYQKRIGSS